MTSRFLKAFNGWHHHTPGLPTEPHGEHGEHENAMQGARDQIDVVMTEMQLLNQRLAEVLLKSRGWMPPIPLPDQDRDQDDDPQ